MAPSASSFAVSTSLSMLLLLLLLISAAAQKPSYVVYLGEHSHHSEALRPTATGSSSSSQIHDHDRRLQQVTDAHCGLLGSVLGDEDRARDAIFYSYANHINGFAAHLEEHEAAEIARHPSVISVFPNRGHQLHTTTSWHFLGLERDGRVPAESLWTKARFGEDTIIGNLDTGVWPESDSFNDHGIGPIPSRWKGVCQKGIGDGRHGFHCNRKLIGARYFNKGFAAAATKLNSSFHSARDIDGHGTHTLSTAGGNFVPGASIFGYGNGTAKGGSPAARVAAYRVCYSPIDGNECFDADILAAFDAAIADGVDVLTVSLGGNPGDYLDDGIAIGSFHAMRRGITVVTSAGNSGPGLGTVSNVAPWLITVAASTMDREFPSYASLGNGKQLKGQSLSDKSIGSHKLYPLISSVNAKAPNATSQDAALCMSGSLDPVKVKGKIVACQRGVNARVGKGETVLKAGGLGMILANNITNGNEIIADPHVLPATHLTYSDGLLLFSYINSTKYPVAYITYPETKLGTKPAPFIASFSSQGPNTVTPEFLKPDITAPGVSVLAAYSGAVAPTNLLSDPRRVRFNSLSGTSMSCPHVAGVVGLLKTLHPYWSPAAIRSAIMTTARVADNMKEPIENSSFVSATPFGYGSGHIRPNRAMDPGLVYDIEADEYLNFLCALGYNSSIITKFSLKPYPCPSKRQKHTAMNYPSITIPVLVVTTTVNRRLKNVGRPGIYTARVVPPAGVSVTVTPSTLKFERIGEEQNFQVSFTPKKFYASGEYAFGSLIWSDGVHYVRTPLVMKPKSKV